MSSALVTGLACLALKANSNQESPYATAQAGRVSVMAYNVENLFDLQHDFDSEGRDKFDVEFLPRAVREADPKLKAICDKGPNPDFCHRSDWRADVLDAKLKNMAQAILQVGSGRGPDILILEEVENMNALQMLNRTLGSAKYPTVELIEGPDQRGIDTAVMSRFPLARASKLHIIEFTGKNKGLKSRGILDVALKVNDKIVKVLAVHLPSQGKPTPARQDALNTINQLGKDIKETPYIITAGDFNVSSREDVETKILGNMSSNWLISRDFMKQNFPGTSYYDRETAEFRWSFLDIILFSPAFKSGSLKLDPASFDLKKNTPNQVNEQNRPLRFNQFKKIGTSDHWPVYSEFSL